LKEAMFNFRLRAQRPLNLSDFDSASRPIACPQWVQSYAVQSCSMFPPKSVQTLRVLRMMVKRPNEDLLVPPELEWLKPTIDTLWTHQVVQGLPSMQAFVYVTVRHGLVDTTTDDEWHVDGFSMRTPHTPEQNYIWCSDYPTEFLINNWNLPGTFDPLRHNIHRFFQMYQEGAQLVGSEPNTIYLIDPYCVHRRSPGSNGKVRTFVRVSFVPIEIEDDTCARNPLVPEKFYGRQDVRKTLTDWSPSV
jgi:hypothetical protein